MKSRKIINRENFHSVEIISCGGEEREEGEGKLQNPKNKVPSLSDLCSARAKYTVYTFSPREQPGKGT